MLFDVPSMKKLTRVPYEETYRPLRQALDRIDPQAFDKIHEELTARFDEREIDTAGWIPGANWKDTIWWPIYLAAGEDQEVSAKFFGQIVWQVVMDHPDCWPSGKYELDGIPIRSRTYFRIECP
jgi:hypothetical protein